ncbi:MAG: acyltransferase [Bacteroidetes bacterium]|nr:acyltransferase [Bacteroidota bacterium]
MGLGILKTYYSAIQRNYYSIVPLGLLILNWIVQRIFRINASVPFSVHYTNKIQGFERIQIGDDKVRTNFAVSGGTFITVFEGTQLKIGAGTIWAYNVCIQTGNHKFNSLDEYEVASITIGENCWLGNGVVLLAGVTLGSNVVVGANAVVTKSFPSDVVIAGVPAKIIRNIGSSDMPS